MYLLELRIQLHEIQEILLNQILIVLLTTLKAYQTFHDIKEEILDLWDARNNTGVPDEVLKHYNNVKDPNYIMMTGDMTKFNNPLIL